MNNASLFEFTITTRPNPLQTDLEGVLVLTAKPKNGQAEGNLRFEA